MAQIVLMTFVVAGYGERNDRLRNDSGSGVDWFPVRFGWNCSDGPKRCEREAKQTPARIAASEKVTVKRFCSNLDIPASPHGSAFLDLMQFLRQPDSICKTWRDAAS